MRIDVYTHFLCLDFIKHLHGSSALPNTVLDGDNYFISCAPGLRIPVQARITDMEEKLNDVEEMKVDVSVLSHGVPGPEILGGQEADDWACRINDHLAKIIDEHPGKFMGWGSIGFGSTERSIAEVDRCIGAWNNAIAAPFEST